jgi:hypothetical protein
MTFKAFWDLDGCNVMLEVRLGDFGRLVLMTAITGVFDI